MARVLIEDTRQQKDKHELKHAGFERLGVSLVRSKLAFGDYCKPPESSVDTKADIYELAYDIDRDHARFKRECVGAREAGVRLVVLIENDDGVVDLETLASWAEPPEHFAKRKNARRRIKGDRLAKACATMEQRYGVSFVFCRPDEAAELIMEILDGG